MEKSGTSLAALLAVVFVVLKLTNVITWSWWWVLSPLWISAAIAVLFVLVLTIIKLSKKDK